MLNLILAVICSASIGLILKFSETRQKNRLAVTTANYFIAFIVSFMLFLREGIIQNISITGGLKGFINEFSKVLLGNGTFSHAGSFGWSVFAGFIGGFLYFSGFILIQKSINKNGVGLTGAFSKIAILIPIVLSIALWDEIPTAIQYVGIVITLFALFFISTGNKENSKTINLSLFNMFLWVGLAEFSNKLFQIYALPQYNALFLFCVFFTAFVISLVSTFLDDGKVSVSDLVIGCLVGIPNMLTSYFLIKSFATIKASIVFPVYSSAAIVLMALGGVVLFSERLRKREITAIAMIIIALILLNK